LRVGVAEAQCGGALAIDLARALQVLEGILAQGAVVTDLLDLEQPPIGGEADAAPCRQVVQQAPDAEVVAVVEVVSVLQGLALLVVPA